jgi:hypothetical protein
LNFAGANHDAYDYISEHAVSVNKTTLYKTVHVCLLPQLHFHRKAIVLIHGNIIIQLLGILKRDENTSMGRVHVRNKGALRSD